MENNDVAEDTKLSAFPETEAAQSDAAALSDAETAQSEIDFDIDFEDDLGPSLEEMLQAATLEVITAQESVGDGEEKEHSAEAVDHGDLDRHWYVVHCYSGYENKVCHNLEQRIESMDMRDQIFDVVVPTEEEIAIKDGKRKTVERQVFPGYILVQMELSEESWYVVRNTPGVTGFVGMGSKPTPLPEQEVSHIIKRMEADAPRITVNFKVDEKVRIVEGPFNDFIGTVKEIDIDRGKVRVMVSFFGRETPVELDFLQVEKV